MIQSMSFVELNTLAKLLLLEPQGRDVEVSHFPNAFALHNPQRLRGIHVQCDLHVLPEVPEEGNHSTCSYSPSDGA